jgi:lysophospholipase L1-like esterase
MKSNKPTILILILTLPLLLSGQSQDESKQGLFRHPWQGKRVAFIGDSFTDPNNHPNQIKKYWAFLEDWLRITPYVYGVSGREWNDVPHQLNRLHDEHGQAVDAILVFLGTNDFNHGVPIGEWFTEKEEPVTAATGEIEQQVTRMRRTPIFTNDTYRGRINIGVREMKKRYPDKQIILLTPMHRAYAKFGERNVQPDESYQNRCGEYADVYADAVMEAGRIWGIPVIDLNAVTGMNPMIEEQLLYFHDPASDRLHPSTAGQERIARTLMYQLLTLPIF